MSVGTIRALILAAGVSLAGFLAGNGFARARSADRYVTVKGVAEREAKADLAIWPLSVVGADNSLTAAHAKLETSIAGVRQFLVKHCIDTSQVELTGFSVTDALANEYGPERRPTNRYIIRETVMVRSVHPDLVLAASQQIGELAAIGVVVSSGPGYNGPGGGPTFVFTGLNKLKPAAESQINKTVRVVSTVEYFLKD